MPGDGAEPDKGDEAKSEAKTCEGKGSQAVGRRKNSSGENVIVIIETHDIYDSSRHT
jgi:hypothetical protein